MDVPLFKQFVLWRGERRLVVGEEDLHAKRIASGPDYMRPVRTLTGSTSDRFPYKCLFLFTFGRSGNETRWIFRDSIVEDLIEALEASKTEYEGRGRLRRRSCEIVFTIALACVAGARKGKGEVPLSLPLSSGCHASYNCIRQCQRNTRKQILVQLQ